MLHIVIPMAGLGSRFAQKGYLDPKPLIQVNNIPMIRLVIENLRPAIPHRFIFICQREHVMEYGLESRLAAWAPDSRLLLLDKVTEGAACTVLLARNEINLDAPLMIANSDQYIDASIDIYLNNLDKRSLDGLIMTMKADDPKWSFVELNEYCMAKRVVEKEVVSTEATVGIYNFRRARDFFDSADAMIAANERVNGEFYVAPVYNRMIAAGAKIGVFNIGAVGAGMYGLGTPDDLNAFLALPVARNATDAIV
jgi:dTDP-glucose pyrophosphorylase